MHGGVACVAGGLYGRGCAWHGVHGGGNAWQGGVHGGVHVWQAGGACVVGGDRAWQERRPLQRTVEHFSTN